MALSHQQEERLGAWERRLLVAGVLICGLGGYFLAGFSGDPGRARTLATPIDDAIPFLPSTMILYVWMYSVMFYPIFVVRCAELFRRVVLAYSLVILVSLFFFVAFPVTSIDLRPDITHLDMGVWAHWLLRQNYLIDPPYNLFPSLHLSLALLAGVGSFMAHRGWGLLIWPLVMGTGISILTVKQHYFLDAIGALILALVAYFVVLRPYWSSHRPAPRSYGWRGPFYYMIFHSAFFGVVYLIFWSGWDLQMLLD